MSKTFEVPCGDQFKVSEDLHVTLEVCKRYCPHDVRVTYCSHLNEYLFFEAPKEVRI